MSRWLFIALLVLGTCQIRAAERVFDFGKYTINESPKDFRSTVSGTGTPGGWKIMVDDAPSTLKALTPQAAAAGRRFVLAQTSEDKTDEHFPVLVYEGDTYADFKFTTLFKTVSGKAEQMAGIAFRIQDEKNYYVIRASSLGNTLRFYKFVEGQRSQPIGPNISIPSGVWHELSVECKGNTIRCWLNGKEEMPALTDNSFSAGKVGFWTKSDSVSYFAEARMTYTPRIPLIQTVVKSTHSRFSRSKSIRVYARRPGSEALTVVGSTDEKEIGQPAPPETADVIATDSVYFGRDKYDVTVTLPLHDRNGEVVAAVRVVMESFAGQTESNAIARARPIGKSMEPSIKSARDMFE